MKSGIPIEDALRIDELRAGFLRYSREAYALLPALDRPRVLDIGCGSGLTTIELARLSGGEVIGIDTDATVLASLRQRIDGAGLSRRVNAVNASLCVPAFLDESFDLLWEEGVLHMIDPSESLGVCGRLLKPSGFLVMHETIAWFESVRERFGSFGFRLVGRHLLPEHCWWTDYYAPLEANIRTLREAHRDDMGTLGRLARYEIEVSMVQADPGRFDCGFFIVTKDRAAPVW
jgi:SAM-dependent methyltransferase